MDELKQLEKIQELERQIAGLPIGYISKKTINGKVRYYHQWTENRKKAQPIIFEMERWRYCRNKLIGASLFKLNRRNCNPACRKRASPSWILKPA